MIERDTSRKTLGREGSAQTLDSADINNIPNERLQSRGENFDAPLTKPESKITHSKVKIQRMEKAPI